VIVLSTYFLLQGCNKDGGDLPYYNTPDLMPVWERTEGAHTIGNFNFINQDSTAITPHSFDGKVYIANFFFTMCQGICPELKNNLQLVVHEFNNNPSVQFLSHSVTPYIDSVPRLKEYAEMHNINSARWHLVTGKQSDIYDAARRYYFAEDEIGFNKDSTNFLHTERVVLVDKDKHIRGVYNGTVQLEMKRLIDDIRILLHD
jgi:protein SCO1/2